MIKIKISNVVVSLFLKIVSTAASQQEGPTARIHHQSGSFLCGVFMFSPGAG